MTLPPFPAGRKFDYAALLIAIDRTGSISAAAKTLDISYKAAWDAVASINNRTQHPVLDCQTGGTKGGGARLSAYGRKLIAVQQAFVNANNQIFNQLEHLPEDFDAFYPLLRSLDMQTSARNQFHATVTAIKPGAVNSEVILDIGGEALIAMITNDSVDHLELAPGKAVIALVKASWIILSPDLDTKVSARNRYTGVIARIETGAVNDEVMIELASGKLLTAIITRHSTENLNLKPGEKVCAFFKPSQVILAVTG
ncbi:MAG: TOBE domain-containing protein [Methylococcales bacterium]|nr:TOBE domain-containing protein [Methylococcales bacterium]